MGTSKSSSSKQEFGFGGLNSGNLNLTNSDFLNTREQNFGLTSERESKKQENESKMTTEYNSTIKKKSSDALLSLNQFD